MMRALMGLLLVAAVVAGCAAPPASPPAGDGGDGDGAPPTAPPSDGGTAPPPDGPRGPSIDGPRWNLGDAWTYTMQRGGQVVTHELVVFRADDEHWWLGLENRTLALEHALRDTNPLVGRIHYGILSPHESGRHAGMYSFPLEDGKAWTGDLFQGTWLFRATWDAAEGRYVIEGTGANNSHMSLDYDPDVRWFSRMVVQGEAPMELALTEHRSGVKGTFHFFRGVDLYAGPGPQGPTGAALHFDEVPVQGAFDALGLALRGNATGPAAVLVLDPSNQERYRRAFNAGDALDELVELPHAEGAWQVVYTGLANLQADVRLAGLETHIETV